MAKSIFETVAATLAPLSYERRLDAKVLEHLTADHHQQDRQGLVMDDLIERIDNDPMAEDDRSAIDAVGWGFAVMASLCRLISSGMIYPAGVGELDQAPLPGPGLLRHQRWELTDLARSALRIQS